MINPIPCPFCRSNNVHAIKNEHYDDDYSVLCYNSTCCCEGPWASTEEEAIQLWNIRFDQSFDEPKNILYQLATKISIVNGAQHSGIKLKAEYWSELYQLTNEAFAVLDRVT